MTAANQNNQILHRTRWLAAFIVPFLVGAFFILYLFPGWAGQWWAWPITPPIMAQWMGAGYVAGGYFFARAVRARRWHYIAVGFPPVSTFATLMGVVTVLHWNSFMSISAWLLFVAQIPFLINFFWSIRKGKKVSANPWEATTLEWSAASSPPIAHGNFPHPPVVVRGPYEYSPPEAPSGFLPQGEVARA